jgi:hypothetical protein
LPPADTNHGHTADRQDRCEFGKTLFASGDCPRPGDVQLDGSCLCVPHAKLMRLEGQESTLLDKVFEMDKWLDGPGTRANQLYWQRMLRQRDEAVERLRFNRTLLEAHEEAIQHR